jgi:hypothetical protein
MSKGNPIVCMRLNAEYLDVLDALVLHHNATTPGEIWTRSDWIMAAIYEKLAKLARSRGRRGKGTADAFRRHDLALKSWRDLLGSK